VARFDQPDGVVKTGLSFPSDGAEARSQFAHASTIAPAGELWS
jgi:hypothetical protein